MVLIAVLLAVVLLRVGGSIPTCAYMDYPSGVIVVAAGNCTVARTVCATNNQCDRLDVARTFTSNVFTNVIGMGRLPDYTFSNLTIKDVPSITIGHMDLPKTVTTLTFDNVTNVNVSKSFGTAWTYIKTLEFINSPFNFSDGVVWPVCVERLTLVNNALSTMPVTFPSTITQLWIRDNLFTDLRSVPTNLTFLNIGANKLKSIVNADLRSLRYLSMSDNRDLTTMNDARFASIAFLNLTNCPNLATICVDAPSYAALNALNPWDSNVTTDAPTGFSINYPIATDAAMCADLGGSIQKLWENTSSVAVAVCVTDSKLDGGTGLAVGIMCSAAITVVVVVLFVLRRRRKPLTSLFGYIQASGTKSTGGLSSSRSGARRAYADAILNVKPLLHHRLQISDLRVTSKKPLGSGVLRENWLGKYGTQHVVIKRMKHQEPRMAQKFIDEIVLMSQYSRNVLLDSVKGTKLTDFGASRVAEGDDTMTNGIGTYQWMAPEVISGTNYGAPADMYSFGVIFSEFATHQVPYADLRHPDSGKPLPQHYVLDHVREGKLHPTFDGEGVPAWVKDIGLQCLSLNEDDRPTALDVSAMLSLYGP
ncbi:TKL protein kinase [Saprolegnia diclina VS20]|uniref:TKL protein kinase n=1 Tax=Saprolegnia diclina (strain VS20) TaxID=1156394 RepID=T0S000_SAPDV|nr:TKL protein kinase [Saprolegnia diclina VS20]EQC38168.1 TKL protein kinase [Saprolegnia diclina VS20]|eukprot:XP_008608495.1 TKL protein kinase [Saprolegnia diclina VS20]